MTTCESLWARFSYKFIGHGKDYNKIKPLNWFKNESPPENEGYQFWDDENINKISDGLENNNHSGATFGFCMRQIQFIAKNGFDEYNKYNIPN
jgi:hypothetical protein